MKEGSYRLIVCVDVHGANDLENAYERVYDAMNSICDTPPVGIPRGSLEWESTDEAFTSDGLSIDPSDIQAARMAVFAKKEA